MAKKKYIRGLGDFVADALSSVGITEELVEKWIGDCKCRERRKRLNTLSRWARSFWSGEENLEQREILKAIMPPKETNSQESEL